MCNNGANCQLLYPLNSCNYYCIVIKYFIHTHTPLIVLLHTSLSLQSHHYRARLLPSLPYNKIRKQGNLWGRREMNRKLCAVRPMNSRESIQYEKLLWSQFSKEWVIKTRGIKIDKKNKGGWKAMKSFWHAN
jgi:hypothetical protein